MEPNGDENKEPNSDDKADILREYAANIPNSFPLCKDVRRYQRLIKIGQGTFGEVFKAKHRKTKKIVALKRIKTENEKEGFPVTALREIKILQTLKHDNIVNLRRICWIKPSEENKFNPEFYLVFDFADHDLSGILANKAVQISLSEKKSILKQLFNGLFYLHINNVLHRDMKSSNILITKKGVLKLADFGLARVYTPPDDDRTNRYTPRMVTLWYRPPEILLGERNYGPPIDLWGAGCIMAELWTRHPIMRGETEHKQLLHIVRMCGSISPAVWPNVVNLNLYNEFNLPNHKERRVQDELRSNIPDSQALDLIDSLLTLDPSKRITAENALLHDFFFEEPMAGDLSLLCKRHPNISFFELFIPQNGVCEREVTGAVNAALVPGPSNSQSATNGQSASNQQPQEPTDQQQEEFEQAF